MRPPKASPASLAFEEAAEEYRRAIRAADRLRIRLMVGLGEKPSPEEMKEAEERIRKAFLEVSKTL